MEHALPRRTAGFPRTWSLCMTGENYGEVGPAGSAFQHRSEKHERVLVVEVPSPAGAPSDQVNLKLVTTSVATPVSQAAVPDVLFDGCAVYAEITRKLGKGHCHSHHTVSATLDAVVRLLHAAPAQAAPLPAASVSAPASAESIECWSHNEEDFSAQSLSELIDTHELQSGATVWVGEAVHPEPSSLFSTDWLIENMGEAAYDIAGEHGGEDYPNVSDEQVAELEALVVGWITKCAPPTFWTVKNVRPYVLTAEDCGDQASTSGERQEGGA